jgi:hypothetical protein
MVSGRLPKPNAENFHVPPVHRTCCYKDSLVGCFEARIVGKPRPLAAARRPCGPLVVST